MSTTNEQYPTSTGPEQSAHTAPPEPGDRNAVPGAGSGGGMTDKRKKVAKKTAAGALARSYRAERVLVSLLGSLALLAGTAALVVGLGWLGWHRARRPVLDPVAVDRLTAQPTLFRIVAIVLGALLLVAGTWWFIRCLRPEERPDVTLGQDLVVTSGAVAGAVRADAERVDGVTKARARLVGNAAAPALRLTLWLREGADLRSVWTDLDIYVLARARTALGVDVLPTAVWLELDAGRRTRVR